MGRELFVVSRDRPDLYHYLTQTFADASNVEVIWDRRQGDRRDAPGGATPERRQGERRNRPTVDEDLRKVGYAFIVFD